MCLKLRFKFPIPNCNFVEQIEGYLEDDNNQNLIIFDNIKQIKSKIK